MLNRFKINAEDFDGPVLLTGAGGCIGSWVLSLLVDAGVPVFALDVNNDKRRPKLLMSDSELSLVKWLVGDISEPTTMIKAIEVSKATSIIHLAALQVPFCKADPIGGAKVNVVGTVNVFEAARKRKISRISYASSVAAHGVFDAKTLPTLYGTYKFCNEQTARVYLQDWGVPSVGLRPGVVYGIGRDQGMTSKTTVAILAAAAGKPYTIPFTGAVSWLHAGEAGSAFIKAVSQPRDQAVVFDINGAASTIEESLEILKRVAPDSNVTASGPALPFPMALSDNPLRQFLGDYGEVPLDEGIAHTHNIFRSLLGKGLISADVIS
ncbi:MAG: NAD-dependent epimerase/dehydratase family protein [Burkholderiales bacterium]|nr:NAD-dependent epimerase/dehydratase family protein [Burkholderiales bacterium]